MKETYSMPLKMVWAITGAGDLIKETTAIMEKLVQQHPIELTVALSKAGVEVVTWYRLMDRLNRMGSKVYIEKSPNKPFIAGPLQAGKYGCLLVAPATANTVAKLVRGIADSLVTNAVAQANKTPLPIFILPVDRHVGTTTTTLPNGKKMTLAVRQVDADNCDRLRQMAGIRTLEALDEIPKLIGRLAPAAR
jgi:archaeoflavoprotein AfpA